MSSDLNTSRVIWGAINGRTCIMHENKSQHACIHIINYYEIRKLVNCMSKSVLYTKMILARYTNATLCGVANSIIGGANIHIFVFTDLKNNWFQKKLMMQNTNIWILAPPIIEFVTPLPHILSFSIQIH